MITPETLLEQCIGYENLEGTVVPMLKVIGGKMEVVSTAYTLYSTTEEAIKQIQ